MTLSFFFFFSLRYCFSCSFCDTLFVLIASVYFSEIGIFCFRKGMWDREYCIVWLDIGNMLVCTFGELHLSPCCYSCLTEYLYLYLIFYWFLFILAYLKRGFRLRVSPDPTAGYIVGYLEEAIPIIICYNY